MASYSHLILLLLICSASVRTEDAEQTATALSQDDLRAMMKRFYAWEDAKRSFDSVYAPKELGEKRKQLVQEVDSENAFRFYAWAGKRSDGQMDKRKQFYAWAGRK